MQKQSSEINKAYAEGVRAVNLFRSKRNRFLMEAVSRLKKERGSSRSDAFFAAIASNINADEDLLKIASGLGGGEASKKALAHPSMSIELAASILNKSSDDKLHTLIDSFVLGHSSNQIKLEVLAEDGSLPFAYKLVKACRPSTASSVQSLEQRFKRRYKKAADNQIMIRGMIDAIESGDEMDSGLLVSAFTRLNEAKLDDLAMLLARSIKSVGGHQAVVKYVASTKGIPSTKDFLCS